MRRHAGAPSLRPRGRHLPPIKGRQRGALHYRAQQSAVLVTKQLHQHVFTTRLSSYRLRYVDEFYCSQADVFVYVEIVVSVVASSSCEPGWRYFPVTNSCYKLIDDELPWTVAEFKCLFQGAHHVSVDSAAENQFVHGTWLSNMVISSLTSNC